MDKAEISKYRKLVNQHLDTRRLVLALKYLKTMVNDTQRWDLSEELNNISTSYNYMLQYLSQGALDPQRDNILAQIITDAYQLTDKTVIALAGPQSTHIFYQRNQQYKNQQLKAMVDEYVVKRGTLQLMDGNNDETIRNNNDETNILRQCENLESDIFNKIWSSFPATTADVETITALLANEELPAHLKSLVLSALTLGLSKFFDAQKLKLLLNSYVTIGDTELKLRALIGAVIIIFLYRNRIAFYNDVVDAFKQLEDEPDFLSDMRLIYTRLIHSRNTENISQKLHDIITPEINKMSSDLLNKIKGKSPGSLEISEIEENPQWQEWLDKSGITNKLEELNELQLQGGDVFISTFSKLKSFPFFNTLSNWFLPYHDKTSITKSAFGDKKHPLTSLFSVMPILCDSDKYSMLLYMASAPESQRNMLFQQFDAQREQLQELQSEETQSVIKMRDNIVNRYIQDLYRFFKLFSRRREFMSIFDTDIKLSDVECLKPFISDTSTLSVIAEFYFKNGFYEDAIKYYRDMISNRDADPHVYQKIAFAQQSLGKLRDALKNYSRYELVNNADTWNTKQMAQCYRSMHNYDMAIEYYNKALELSPQSVNLCLNLGHCYLDKGEYDNALQQYYKADFMPKAKHRAWRPIAWCSLLTGKHEQAVNYYEKIINDDTPSSQDYLNYGHVLQSMGRIADALTQYRKSLDLDGNDQEAFSRLYFDDAKYLVNKLGIPSSDYALVLDAVLQTK
jgi:tetratricopeptide (TPR) repeat protein